MIIHPLSIIYRSFIDLHTLPLEWKTAIIIPVFKKGSPSDPSNYRPIALTPTCCKILESLIAAELIKFLNDHNLICKHQHGFLKKHSTITNLLESVNDWTLSLSNKKSVAIAYIDFTRAFDSVSHPKLLHKLESYGIHGNLLFWILSFLTERRQSVKVGSSFSKFCPVSSGIPQGSVIGPLLFNLFINDITDQLDNTTTSKIFADDIKIYTEFDIISSTNSLQNHLDLIHKWSTSWQLPISHSKCNMLFLGRHKPTTAFNISNSPLNVSEFIVDLGVTIDPELKFSNHIIGIVTRAKQRAALIHRCFLSRKICIIVRAFKTYVRPLVEYAPQIWSPYLSSLISLIEGVQRSFTKRLQGLTDLSYSERLVKLKLQSLEHRRLIFDLVLCYNIVHGLNALPFDDFFAFTPNSTTRGHRFKLSVPIAKINLNKYTFSSRVVPVWNSLPSDFVSACSTYLFKKLINQHNLNKCLTIPTYNP